VKLEQPGRVIVSATIVDNSVVSTQTGNANARIVGLHGALVVTVALAYFTISKRTPSSYGSNAFNLYGRIKNADGESTTLSPTSLNSGQNAPDAWEGTTNLPELDLVHAYQGTSVATDVGHWEVIVTAVPAYEMCDKALYELCSSLDVVCDKVKLS
jgi:hypothetical protein